MNYFRKLSSITSRKARRLAIREADMARDKGDSTQAALLYGEVIKRWNPTFGLLVQYGNALKDSGTFERAEEAYQSALTIKPNDADCLLQLGHLMKLAGDPSRAERFYKEANRLDPTSHDILVELRAIDEQRAARPSIEHTVQPPITAEPQSPAVIFNAIDRGSRPLIIRQRIMNEFSRRRN